MTKYTTSNGSDWVDDLDLAQLRGMNAQEADELLTAQAERLWRPVACAHVGHRVCEASNLDLALDDDSDDDVVDDTSTQQDDTEFASAQSMSQLRRDAKRELREQARIEAHSQHVFRRLHQRFDSRPQTSPPSRPSPNVTSQRTTQQSAPSHQHRRRWYRQSKPRQQPNAGAVQGSSSSAQRRQTNDPSQR